MRVVRTSVFLGLALLALPLFTGKANAQLFFPIRQPLFPFSSWYGGFGGPWYNYPGYSYPGGYFGNFGGYGGYYGGLDPYGATFAPYRYVPLTVAYASSAGTYVPSQVYARANYVSETPYTEPSFVRPAGYANSYHSSRVMEETGSVRAAGYFNGVERPRHIYYESYPMVPPYYYGAYCR